MRVLNRLARPLLALDVGTAMTRVCAEDSAITELLTAVHEDLGGATIVRQALRGGVVSDIAATAQILAPVIRAMSKRWRRAGAVVCAPSDASPQERDRLVEAVNDAGASVAWVAPEPLAAAVGAGLDVSSEYVQMIVDAGEGVTDVAWIANGALCGSDALRIGCFDIRRSVIEWLQWHRRMLIDDAAADVIVRSYCSAEMLREFEIKGRDLDRDSVVHRVVTRDDIGMLIDPVLDLISGFVADVFKRLPDPSAVQVIESGLTLTGGGALLDSLVKNVEAKTRLHVTRAADPLHCVIKGAREMLHNPGLIDIADSGLQYSFMCG